MYKLIQGHESEVRLKLLFQLTNMRSESIKNAVVCHLSAGRSEKDAAFIHDIPRPNLSRAIAKLENVASIVERIKEEDWEKLSLKR